MGTGAEQECCSGNLAIRDGRRSGELGTVGTTRFLAKVYARALEALDRAFRGVFFPSDRNSDGMATILMHGLGVLWIATLCIGPPSLLQ